MSDTAALVIAWIGSLIVAFGLGEWVEMNFWIRWIDERIQRGK